jgi:hypothetical protein
MTARPDESGGRLALANASVPKMVCIIGVPRTGSHHLERLLASCPEFNVQREIFHDKTLDLNDGDRRAVEAAAGTRMADEAATVAWCRAHPIETLETLFESGGGKPLFFKLFPGHLTRDQIAQHLFPRKDVCYLVLRRRPIESYISNRKARLVGVYAKKDTTDTRALLDADQFSTWAHNIRGWYDWNLRKLMRLQRPFLEVIYETDLENVPGPVALESILDRLAHLGLSRPMLPIRIFTGERQDRETDYRNRVDNWTEFESRLAADPERAELLRWAQTLPEKAPAGRERARAQLRMVCLLSMSRTDSNDLRRLLKSCRRLNVQSDVFNPKRMAEAGNSSPLTGGEVDEDRAAHRRASFARQNENVDDTLERLIAEGNNKPLLFTLSAGHLARAQVATQIFSRADMAYLVLKRRPIESFISGRMLRSEKGATDDSDMPLTLNVHDFAQWAKKARRWHDWAERELEKRGRPVLELQYETDIETAPAEALLGHILSEMRRVGFAEAVMPAKVPDFEVRKSPPDYRNHVANWAQFEAELRSDPLHSELLAWAERIPAEAIGGANAISPPESETAAS